MSLYRFARLTAIVALLRRFRVRILRMLFAIAFALTTAWLYGDVAGFIASHHPQWAALTLVLKTLIVYAALFLCFWEVSRMARGDGASAERRGSSAAESAVDQRPASTLDRLARKPELASRKDGLMDQPPGER